MEAWIGWLFARRRQIRATAICHFRRHADALAQRRMRMDGLANVHGIRAHLDSQRDLADHAAAQDLAVAVGLGRIVERQLGHTLVAAVGDAMSPMVKMCDTLVRIWISTLKKPRSVTATPAFSAAIFLPLGLDHPKALRGRCGGKR